MIVLHARSELSRLAELVRRFRCTSADTGRAVDLDELNPSRARIAAWRELGGDMQKVRVEPAPPRRRAS